MTKVIATDLDGTLFYPKKRISMIPKKNRLFLQRFIKDGGRLVVVTSRHSTFTNKIAGKLGAPVDIVGTNGAYIVSDGKIIHEQFFEAEPLRKLVLDLRENYDPKLMMLTSKRYPIIQLTSSTTLGSSIMYFLYEAVQGVYGEQWRSSDHLFFQEISKGEATKLMVLIGLRKKKQRLAKKITEKLQQDYPDFDFCWLNQFIEITPKGCSKASAVSFYLDYLGINHDNVAVVGDSGNDVPMFEEFYKNSYCMKHAPEPIRAQAAHVIKFVSDLEPVLCPSEDDTPSEKEG